MNIFQILLIAFASMYVTWVMYLSVMNLIASREKGTLKWQAKIFAYPVAVVGILMDVLVNVFIASFLFLEFPEIKKLLLTARLQKHCGKDTWRGKLARWICENLLDPFDPSGKHCKPD